MAAWWASTSARATSQVVCRRWSTRESNSSAAAVLSVVSLIDTDRDTTFGYMLDELTRGELLEAPVEREQRVTPLELFFDLVFVFAITQVTAFLYHDPTWTRLLQAIAILIALWIAWSGYVWLGNTAATDEGTIRVVLFTAMGAVLIASRAVPHAFGKD